MKRFATLVVLTAILVGLILVNRVLAGRHPVVSGEAGDLLYVATFDDNAPDWGQYDDGQLAAEAEDGVLRLSVNAESAGAFSTADAHFGDFDLHVTATAVDGPLDNGFGVIFRLQTKDNQRLSDDSYYLFLISSDGYYRVTRTVDGTEHIISDWIPSGLIQEGFEAENTLRVVGQGGSFQFFVNNQPVQLCIPNDPDGISTYALQTCIDGSMMDMLQDDAISAGQIGVVARATETGGAGVVVDFDNMLIFAPQGGA